MNNKKNKFKLYIKAFMFSCIMTMPFHSYGQDLIPFTNQMTGKKGFMDESGKIIIKPTFESVSPFYDGISVVYDEMKNYYINTSGQIIWDSEKYYQTTKRINRVTFDLKNFSCGYGLVSAGIEYFFIDKTGKMVSPTYRYAESFSDDKSIIYKEGKLFAINKSFQILFEIEVDPYDRGEYFGFYNDGLMRVKNIQNVWGYLDSNGKLCLKPSYIYPGKFYNGHAIVRDINGKWMVINKKGEMKFEFEMKQHWDFPESMSLLFKDKLIYTPEIGIIHIVSLLDNSEKEVKLAKLSLDYYEGIQPIIVGNYIFYDGKALDLNGNIIWQLDKFKSIKSILYGKYLLIEKTYDDVHLYKSDGTEIIFP